MIAAIFRTRWIARAGPVYHDSLHSALYSRVNQITGRVGVGTNDFHRPQRCEINAGEGGLCGVLSGGLAVEDSFIGIGETKWDRETCGKYEIRARRNWSALSVVGKFVPGLFLHIYAEFFGGASDSLPGFVSLTVGNALHLIESGDGVPHVRGVF